MVQDTAGNPDLKRNQVFLKRALFILFWSVLFTLAYAQSPLYSSNQNQYFLQGLADAGVGYLDQDWLANTLDPTPVFSWLVKITHQIIPWAPVFYLFFGALAGLMIFSLYNIYSGYFPQDSRTKRFLTLSALLLINSAGIRFFVVRIMGANWVYLFDGGVAGQRLLGSILQPSAFGVFFLLSIYLFLKNKPFWAILPLVLTPTIHPTYLLSGAVLTLIYMGLEFYEKKKLGRPLLLGALTLVGVVPILVHTMVTFGGTSSELLTRGQEILVHFRIPHHAVPADWFEGSAVVKIAIILAAIILTRKTKLFHILFWSFLAAAMGTLVQLVIDSDTLALLFPWRLSTWLIPLSTTAVIFSLVERAWPWLKKRVAHKFIIVVCVAISAALAGFGLAKSNLESGDKNSSPDRSMMAYVSENKTPEDVCLIPLDMQDFRLITGAPVYTEFKSIPYKDVEVIEWHRRIRAAGRLYNAPRKRDGCAMASELHLEGVTHIILPYDHTIRTCSNLEKEYSDGNYAVFKIVGE